MRMCKGKREKNTSRYVTQWEIVPLTLEQRATANILMNEESIDANNTAWKIQRTSINGTVDPDES